MNEYLLTPVKTIGLLLAFGGGHFLTTMTKEDLIAQSFSKDLEALEYPHLWMLGFLNDPTITRLTILDKHL